MHFSDKSSPRHAKSLKYLDLYTYGSACIGVQLDFFNVPKEIVITPHLVMGSLEGEMGVRVGRLAT